MASTESVTPSCEPITRTKRSLTSAILALAIVLAGAVSACAARAEQGVIVLRNGQSWSGMLPAAHRLELFARMDFPHAAGSKYALDILVNGRRVTGPLLNKAPVYSFADGRTYPYYDPMVPGWSVFYSPDFKINDFWAGGEYEVVSDQGQAYRYVWDISHLMNISPTMHVQIRANRTGPRTATVIFLRHPGY